MDSGHYALLPPLEQGLAPFLASLQPGAGPGTHTHTSQDSSTSAGAARAHDGVAHPPTMRASTRTSSRLQPLMQHSAPHYDYSDWINSHGHYDALDGSTDVLLHPAPPPSSESALAAGPSFAPYNPTKFALDAASSGSHHANHFSLRASRRLSNVPGSQYFNASPFLASDNNQPPFHKASMGVSAAFDASSDTFPPHPLQHLQGRPRSLPPPQPHVTRAQSSHHQSQSRSSTSPSRHVIALAAAPNAEPASGAPSSSPTHPRPRDTAATVPSMASANSKSQPARPFAVSSSTTQKADPVKSASTAPMTRSGSRSSPIRGAESSAAHQSRPANKTPATDGSASTLPTAASASIEPVVSGRGRRSAAAELPQDAANQPASDRSSRSKTAAAGLSKPPTQEPDAEAALHLLRLAQPDGSVEDASNADACSGANPNEDEAAELSDASSLHSLGVGSAFSTSTKATTVGSTATVHPNGGPVGSATARARRGRMSNESTQSMGSPGLGQGPLFGAMDGVETYAAREWHYSDDAQQAPLHLPMPGYTSRAPSVASSNASASRAAASKSHRPARLQREAAAAAASALAQQADASSSARRLSSRTRKLTVEVEDEFDAENDDDFRSAYGDVGNDARGVTQDFSDSDDDDDDDGTNKRRGRGRKSATAKGKGKGKAKPRASTAYKRGSETPLNATPAKKSRTSTSSNAGSTRGDTPGSTFSTTSTTRQSRRQPVAPLNLVERTFPPEVEKCSASFPRFYRAFPLSSAFPPDSFVHRGTGLPMPTSATAGTNAASAIASSSTIPALTLPSLSSHLSASAQASTSSLRIEDNTDGSAQFGAMLPPYPSAPQTSDTPPASTLSFFDCPSGAKWHKGADPFNIYMPRIVRGSADSKEALCPVCVEPVARGGEGEEKWLKLKNSSFVYHMSYSHGLSNLTGLPFSPPVRFRRRPTGTKTKDTRDEMTDGLCHKCNEWIPLLSVKKIDTLIPELIWWKHAKKCHGESQIPGEGDFYVRDAMFDFVSAKKAQHGL
ncbi:BQ2448_911 [Microbotryum intermedium]|uniref:BQ2448_911 protein n=1 Tax=Microbotryum intermedium TaxID=269621 RepID=A0A238F400_9BASI|nr:BQ2448_911 [Microbotryum intermedium]